MPDLAAVAARAEEIDKENKDPLSGKCYYNNVRKYCLFFFYCISAIPISLFAHPPIGSTSGVIGSLSDRATCI